MDGYSGLYRKSQQSNTCKIICQEIKYCPRLKLSEMQSKKDNLKSDMKVWDNMIKKRRRLTLTTDIIVLNYYFIQWIFLMETWCLSYTSMELKNLITLFYMCSLVYILQSWYNVILNFKHVDGMLLSSSYQFSPQFRREILNWKKNCILIFWCLMA